MRKINIILQEILRLFVLFLFFFVWIRYFIRDFAKSTILSIVCVLLFEVVCHVLKKKNKLRKSLKLTEKTKAENMFLSLALSSQPTNFFYELAKTRHQFVEKTKKYVCIDYPIEKVKTLLFFNGNYAGLETKDLIEIYKTSKRENPTKIVVCCKEIADKQIYLLLGSFAEKIVILDQYETYKKLYKLYDVYPKITIQNKQEKKLVFKDLVAYSFNKKRTKGYLLSAFVLIFSSLFVRQTLYYCVASSMLFVMAFLSQFNVRFNKKQDNDVI